MFSPPPNLADNVNHAIVQSEVEGGVFLHDLPPSTILEIQTLHHCYTAVLLGGSDALISGHPEFCPSPVQVAIAGSTWGGSMLKLQYVGRGMHLEFRHPEYDTPIVTSPIQEIRDSQPVPATHCAFCHPQRRKGSRFPARARATLSVASRNLWPLLRGRLTQFRVQSIG